MDTEKTVETVEAVAPAAETAATAPVAAPAATEDLQGFLPVRTMPTGRERRFAFSAQRRFLILITRMPAN